VHEAFQILVPRNEGEPLPVTPTFDRTVVVFESQLTVETSPEVCAEEIGIEE